MKPLQNEMILASAGSGKTYRLTSRFVHLLALGVPPERIIALTFTRKAAAEFLDEILKKLAKAAAEPAAAHEMERQLGLDYFDSRRALELLRLVVDRLHLLTLGTLDSFFHRILACFPAEFGLGSGFEVMNPYEEKEARSKVFDHIFSNRRLHAHFVEAFKKATFGSEERALQSRLDDFVKNHHRAYLRQPNRSRWGEELAIWPGGCRWLHGPENIELACADLERATEAITFDKKAQGMWDTFLATMRTLQPGKPSGDRSTTLKRLLELYPEIAAGGPVTVSLNGKNYPFPPAACQNLASVLDYFLFCEVFPHLQRTRGIYQILHTFERDYHDQVRRSGRLGFEDIQMLLNGSLQPLNAQHKLSIEGGEGRLHVDYRLDGQFDHWLLDEFQDTSNGQWQVIANLIDEVLQDTEGRRSLFYVGDVKQAIFGWRGGDAALFDDIYQHYNDVLPGSIRKEHMEDSRRSGPALMESINRVFGDIPRLRSLLPDHAELADRWAGAWAPHTTHHKDRRDYVELLTLPKEGDTELSPEERRLAVVTALVQELAPHQKQLSCAILVRKNDTATALANAIRAHTDVPVTVETDTLIGMDHPVASSFLSLLQFAAHPGDTVAWKHLCMTPAFAGKAWQDFASLRHDLVPETLALIHDHGFRKAFEGWLSRLTSGGFVPDAFALRRIGQLRQAANDFDEKGNRSIADFLRYAQAASTRESPADGVVQIMTIHKSKGLGFDVVILAELEESPLSSTGTLSLVAHETGSGLDREIDWVLSMPAKDLCQLDPALRAARHRCEIDSAYEGLCVLYVALTRAKFATHIVCMEAPDELKGSARDLVVSALGQRPEDCPTRPLGQESVRVACALGDPDWFETRKMPPPVPPERASIPSISARRRFPPRHRAMPSSLGEDGATQKGKSRFLFSRASREAATYGTKVHGLFEEIAWLEELGPRGLSDQIAQLIDPENSLDLAVRDEVLGALAQPEIESLFRRNSFGPNPILWREKRFEIILNEAWVSGTFDRVVLTPERGWIYDFKTNRVSSEQEIAQASATYQPQLAVYRQALARLTALAPESIETRLVFTKPGVVI